MKLLIILMMMSTTANAIEQGDYGYGYQYHGYYSLEQQQEAQRDQYNLQQIEQTQLDIEVRNRLNGGQLPEVRDFYGEIIDSQGEE